MRPRIGVSACLLGEEVRWNKGHKRLRTLTDELGPFVEWVPICPEMEIGLGVPRPRIHLEKGPDGTELVGKDGVDHAPAMEDWSDQWLGAVGELHGFVLKSRSPSCGPIVNIVAGDKSAGQRPGIFAAKLHAAMPLVPSIDDGRIRDPHLREHFLDQVMGRFRWTLREPGHKGLQAFQAANKYTLLSHSPAHTRRLGRMAAEDDAGYEEAYHEALAVPTTRGRHVNVMQHLAGFIQLDARGKSEFAHTLQEYVDGLVPLAVPLALLRFLLRTHEAPEWALQQSYLAPYPAEWRLRNA